MPETVNKKIKIDVDSKDLIAAQKTLQAIQKSLEALKKGFDSQLKIQQSVFNLLKESLKKEQAALKNQQSKVKAVQEEERSLIKINELKKQIQRKEEERLAQYKTQRASQKVQEEWEKRQLEKAKPSFLEQYQKVRRAGVGAGFSLLGERAQEQGEARIKDIDIDLAKERGQSESLKRLYEQQVEARKGLESNPEFLKLSEEEKQAKRIEADTGIEEAFDAYKKQEEKVSGKEKERSKAIGETKTQVNKYAAMAKAAEQISGQFKKIASAVGEFVLKPFRDLKNQVASLVTSMVDLRTGIATFNASTSLITNATARETQLKYGLTSSQTYGFTKAREMLNIQSDEDLMYMNADQRERLLSYMERYSNWYDELESSGVLSDIQEMQLEFNELKEELAMEFLQWVAENKDTIMMCIRGIFEVIKVVATAVLKVMNLLTGGKYENVDLYDGSSNYNNRQQASLNDLMYRSARISDEINNGNYDNSKNTNITINATTTNNATGVLGTQEALDQFNKDNWSRLAKDIVGAIGG